MLAQAVASVQTIQVPAGTSIPAYSWLFECNDPTRNVSNTTNGPECSVLLQPGIYVARVSRLGYEAASAEFTVEAPPPPSVDVDVPVSVVVTLS